MKSVPPESHKTIIVADWREAEQVKKQSENKTKQQRWKCKFLPKKAEGNKVTRQITVKKKYIQ